MGYLKVAMVMLLSYLASIDGTERHQSIVITLVCPRPRTSDSKEHIFFVLKQVNYREQIGDYFCSPSAYFLVATLSLLNIFLFCLTTPFIR